jgi:hypothetical protein
MSYHTRKSIYGPALLENEKVYESATRRDPASGPKLTETTAPFERNTQLI